MNYVEMQAVEECLFCDNPSMSAKNIAKRWFKSLNDEKTDEPIDLLTTAEYQGDDEIEKLKAENAEYRLWQDDMQRELKSWREFFQYLNGDCVGSTKDIIEELSDMSHWEVLGKVTVERRIGEHGKLLLAFDIPGAKICPRRIAEWQASSNYGVWQTCGMVGDDYSGYMLLPTYKDCEYLCVWFAC